MYDTEKINRSAVILRCLPAIFLAAYFTAEPEAVSAAAYKSAYLWAHSVLPSLLPFFVISKYMLLVGAPSALALKGVNPAVSFAIFVSALSGNPVGSKTVCELYSRGELSKSSAQSLLSFCANAGPMFVIATVGVGFFKSALVAALMSFVNYFSCLVSGLVMSRLFTEKNSPTEKGTYRFAPVSSPVSAFAVAVTDSAAAIINVGAYIIFFGVIISLTEMSGNPLVKTVFSAFSELTRGEQLIASYFASKPITALTAASFTLGWGGLCVVMQCASYITSSGLSVKRFVLGKILQAIFAAITGYFLAILFF